ncbi:MAG: hypothetical protein A2977_02750 [Alphaproteobacteria bacterium RIFCSPLOWO2_01_FULL_45_8]|nr:MAG: hypothetical protein A2065_03915 [Alphaproteobacteria bacterium GWB1_45_5]OFW75951.1 MAG: hypothetical protein A3K20_03965 [Alphaproteobacteria bacterium GWA1_45_9]OFW90043.1 MAG: hypothetical protein A2621_04170 [Alphaproteobacteria bacterium RIFCSPHIGHO2_01_FULL_41_14]OFW96672.1 MAG: hypothetical protein A2977_02750 [Alphaproteobacteria bacterium RIFCSPLOWO2_01_FULL_45_8]HCI49181.1 DUF4280 domain-containing protein [Holosporales bacterium]
MPGPVVTTGAMAMCTMGTGPGVLNFMPPPVVNCPTQAGKITDIVPIKNIPSFILCISLANPVVAAATASHLGVLTPMPCVPAPAGPWIPGSASVFLGGIPMLNSSCMLHCSYAGVITITFPGQKASICTK